MKTFIKNMVLLGVSVLVTFAVVEVGSRYIMPVEYGHKLLTLQGEPMGAYSGEEALRPDTSYRVLSQEFDTVVTHTKEGYRGLSHPLNPEVVFIGDSFTYGIGLNDKETIPHIYCRELDLICANLGVPGTATVKQLSRLEKYLTKYNWRPREVKLMFMGMTSALLAGNDFNGNVEEAAARRSKNAISKNEPAQKTLWAKIIDQRALMLEHSNLVRIVYYIGGPLLRAKLSPQTNDGELKRALDVTARQFARLEELSTYYKFDYSIHVIHPMQDIMTGGHEKTLTALKRIAKTDKVYTTAAAFDGMEKVQQFYFPMDGHFNRKGAETVARFMARQDRTAAKNGNKSSEM